MQQRLRGPRRQRAASRPSSSSSTAPFVLFLLLGGAEVGRAFIHYATLTYSVRDSARFVSENSINGTTGVVASHGTTVTRARNLAVYGNIEGTGKPELPNFQTSQVQVVERRQRQHPGHGDLSVPADARRRSCRTSASASGSIPLTFNMQVAVTMRAIS